MAPRHVTCSTHNVQGRGESALFDPEGKLDNIYDPLPPFIVFIIIVWFIYERVFLWWGRP